MSEVGFRMQASNSSSVRPRLGEYAFVFLAFSVYYLLYFAPVWTKGVLLAPGDGAISYYPAVLRGFALWDDLILGGYPSGADPQQLTWYPLRWLGLLSYNALVISAYVIAAFGAYGYVRSLPSSRTAASVAGVIYSGSGFMLGHLGHLTIIHSAAWIPWMLWGAESYARTRKPVHGQLMVLGVAMSFLGGHPQPWVYGLCLTCVYVLWRGVAANRADEPATGFRYIASASAYLALGVGVACVELLPFAQLVGLGQRTTWTIGDFSSFSLPTSHLILGIFPNLFGNVSGYYAYFGVPSPTELGFYGGTFSLLLASIGAFAAERLSIRFFWLVVAMVALAFMLGQATPLADIAFRIPLINHFRAPARAGVIADFALAVLAAVGMDQLRTLAVSRSLRIGVAAFALLLGSALIAVYLRYDGAAALAAARRVAFPSFWANPAVWIPVAFAIAGVLTTLAIRTRLSRVALATSLVLIAMDLASFGWFYEWRFWTFDPATATVDGAWTAMLRELRENFGRVMALDGERSPPGPGLPNMNLLFDAPAAGGYGPLLPARYADVAGVATNGSFISMPLPQSPLWDVLGVRYVMGSKADQELSLGDACGAAPGGPKELKYKISNLDIAAIRVESMLGCSVNVPDGTPLLDFAASPEAHITMVAGRDSSEWAWDRPDVRNVVRHRRATVSESFVSDGADGHWYVSTLPLQATTDALTVTVRVPTGSIMRLRRLSLLDSVGNASDVPLRQGLFDEPSRWEKVPNAKNYNFTERFLPYAGRAWLVDAVAADEPRSLEALRTGRLRGVAFDPRKHALLKDVPPELSREPIESPVGTVDTRNQGRGSWRFNVIAKRASLLFISQSDYPGWRATIDGASAPILRANYAFQGIVVPAGQHVVEMRFRPMSTIVGGIVSLAALMILGGVWLRSGRASVRDSLGAARRSAANFFQPAPAMARAAPNPRLESPTLDRVARGCFAIILFALAAYALYFYRALFHSDDAVLDLLAERMHATGALYPPDWIYSNGDLLLPSAATIIAALRIFLPPGFRLHGIASVVAIALVLGSAAWWLRQQNFRPWLRMLVLAVLASGFSSLFCSLVFAQTTYAWAPAATFAGLALLISYRENPSAAVARFRLIALASIVLALGAYNPQRFGLMVVVPLYAFDRVLALATDASRSRRRLLERGGAFDATTWALVAGLVVGGAIHAALVASGVHVELFAARAGFADVNGMLAHAQTFATGWFDFLGARDEDFGYAPAHDPLLRAFRAVLAVAITAAAAFEIARFRRCDDPRRRALAVACAVSFVAVLVPYIALPSLANDWKSLRYFTVPIVLMLALAAYPLADFVDRNARLAMRASYALCALVLLAGIARLLPLGVIAEGKLLPPSRPMALAQALADAKLENGYASFLNAGSPTVVGDFASRIAPIELVDNAVRPYPVLVSTRWYAAAEANRPTFLALAASEASPQRLAAYAADFGQPTRTIETADFKILSFDHDIARDFACASSPELDAPLDASDTRAEIALAPDGLTRLEQGALVTVTIVNRGQATWSSSGRRPVHLGAHLSTERGEAIAVDWVRAALPCAIAPGETRKVHMSLPPLAAGRYRIDVDAVQEDVRWFAASGTVPLQIPYVVDATPAAEADHRDATK